MAAKKKAMVATEVQVRLNEDELAALQQMLKLPRKPTISQVKKHFEQIIDHEINEMLDSWDRPADDDE